MVATKFVPIVSIWEIEEGREESAEVAERVAGYLPEPYRKLLDFRAIGDE
jgi:hypothetical protein